MAGSPLTYSAITNEELVRACAQSGDALAWEEFIRRFHRLVATVAMRTAARWGETSRQIIDDLVQETYLKLCADNCRLLRQFELRHPDAVYGYLKVVTANVVHDHFKALRSAKRSSGTLDQEIDPAEISAPGKHASSAELMERDIFLKEVDGVLQSCTSGPTRERDRRIFWLYYRLGLTAPAIASLPSIGLSVKGVESIILRLTRLVRSEIGERRAGEHRRPAREGIQPSESL